MTEIKDMSDFQLLERFEDFISYCEHINGEEKQITYTCAVETRDLVLSRLSSLRQRVKELEEQLFSVCGLLSTNECKKYISTIEKKLAYSQAAVKAIYSIIAETANTEWKYNEIEEIIVKYYQQKEVGK